MTPAPARPQGAGGGADAGTEVTAAGIARLAGVGRAAVSNWRRRHADFPKPVGGTETSPTFALGEVEQWLRAQGKLAEVPLRERVWQLLAGHPAGAAAALRQVGAVLLLVRHRPTTWDELKTADDAQLAQWLPTALAPVLTARLGENHPVPVPEAAELQAGAALTRGAAELAVEAGPAPAFEFLLGRYLATNPRQYTLTPPDLAELMADLAGVRAADPAGTPDPAGPTVFDPAAGTGWPLGAATAAATLHGQEADPDLAAIGALRLALGSDTVVRFAAADSLRADAFPGLAADAVICHPPFNERNWGHDELAYDPRWEYGFPARTESELAWVQHALARLRDGGTAVLLMPPAVASRRSGRRIRADLLRRGALRAVIALPAGAAPPHGIPLHLWVLRRPGAGSAPAPDLLLVDAAEAAGPGRGKPDQPAVYDTVLTAWRSFDQRGRVTEQPGVCRALPVIELLDDDVDLAPARHLPLPAAGGIAELTAVRDRLTVTLARTTELTPVAPGAPDEPSAGTAPARTAGRWPMTTVGELARAGALVLRTGGAVAGGTGSGGAVPGGAVSGAAAGTEALPVLTEHDVLAGTAPSGSLPPQAPTERSGAEEPVLTEPGDVVVPVLGGGTVARVVDEATAGAALARNLCLLRPDPAALDPWFLAGHLRGSANQRQASSYASTATRLDVRRLQLPRLPLAEQRRYGERYQALAAFEEALRLAGRLGEQLVQGLYDGLADGTVTPR
ncbi:N-6 DNA methylase [Streptomyces palmae]|uniref:SAM-dependent methyltransferase n=1 Tax=Streptomyces palmae TaxID=1701085 RepID=A0A4Z0GFX0_9ACTN|nr:N-6 DNA methylase [Streptomyces palmae]TGA95245.1 SAM-dependent methyltransferase [Streptomyces palmae]